MVAEAIILAASLIGGPKIVVTSTFRVKQIAAPSKGTEQIYELQPVLPVTLAAYSDGAEPVDGQVVTCDISGVVIGKIGDAEITTMKLKCDDHVQFTIQGVRFSPNE